MGLAKLAGAGIKALVPEVIPEVAPKIAQKSAYELAKEAAEMAAKKQADDLAKAAAKAPTPKPKVEVPLPEPPPSSEVVKQAQIRTYQTAEAAKPTRHFFPKEGPGMEWRQQYTDRLTAGESPQALQKELGHWTNPDNNIEYGMQMNTKKGVWRDPVNMTNRGPRSSRRTTSERISKEAVTEIAERYNAVDKVDDFIKYHKDGKKQIDNVIKSINDRIKSRPDLYPKDFKASLGHRRAAKSYLDEAKPSTQGGANMVENLEVENLKQNSTRGANDEISDSFNRALGRSLDLEEGFLKFIDPDLGSFHKGFNLGRHQQRWIIDYVTKNANKPVRWQDFRSTSGQQLFKSKMEYLINEAIQIVLYDKGKL